MSIMMYNKTIIRACVIIYSMLFWSCEEVLPTIRPCTVRGTVKSTIGHTLNGVKVTLENTANSSLIYVAIADAKGTFEINDILPGNYYIYADKDGDVVVSWLSDGGVNKLSNEIKLTSGQGKKLIIYLAVDDGPGIGFQLEITDIYGNIVEDSIHIPKYTPAVVFYIHNRTDSNQYWTITGFNRCRYSTGTPGRDYRTGNIFSSFEPTSGNLKSGGTALIVGNINQEIFSGYARPSGSNTIYFEQIIGHKTVELDIEF